jgi:Glycosyltransferase WbsX
MIVGTSPNLYQQWLAAAARKAKSVNKGEPTVLVNAWNEWAEGNHHLEPCQK